MHRLVIIRCSTRASNSARSPAQAFLQMQPPLSPALVLSILGDSSPDLSALYLEAALHMGLALPQVG